MEQPTQPTPLPPEGERQRPPSALALILAIALTAATTYVRLVWLADYVLPIAYSVPLLVIAWFRDRRLVWGMAGAFAAITAYRYASEQPMLGAPTSAMRAFDWGLILIELLAVSAMIHAFIGVIQSREQANQRAQAANTELLAHQRQVAAQNEQLRWHAQELRQATERSQQREQVLEAVLTTTPLGIAITDARLREVRLNPAAAALLGLPSAANVAGPADMLTGLRFLRDGQALPPEQHPIARAAHRGERIVNDELQLLLPDGRCVTLLVSAAPIRAGDDGAAGGAGITGAVAAIVDISDQKLLQQELDRRRQEAEESSSRKTRFLAAVSHDIRTPANAINLMSELLHRASSGSAVPAEVAELAREMRSSAVALVNLVSDVLDVTRFDTGRIELTDSDFSLGLLIEEQCRRLALLAGQRGLSFECRQPQSPIWVRADRIKLARILDNLVDNAIKYTPAGSVHVTAEIAGDGRVQIDVADTGIGIAPEQQAGIFDEFVQLRNPQRDRNSGTGLGLAISRRLAAAMGGDLTVHSAPGRGSTFALALPAWRVVQPPPVQHPDPPEPPARPATPLAGLRVLLVEDHESTRRATARLLSQEGAQVTQTAEGAAALKLLHAEPCPQVLLLDMVLPDLDGAEVLRRLRQDRPPALQAILVLTGDTAPDRTDEVSQLGADALIAKPVDAQKLVEALRQRVWPQPQPRSGQAPTLSR